jgi:hypothetical protein
MKVVEGHVVHLAELGDSARRPAMYHSLARKPVLSRCVVLTLWHEQGDEHVDSRRRPPIIVQDQSAKDLFQRTGDFRLVRRECEMASPFDDE